MADRHPATTAMLRWFEYDHLPPHLQAVSKPVGDLAHELVEMLPDGAELTTGLRKLLEAKDCLVRSAVDVPAEQLAASRSRLADNDGPGVAYLKGVAAGRREVQPMCGDTIDDPAASRMRSCTRFVGHDTPHGDRSGVWPR